MPITRGKDKAGYFYRYGSTGHKYRYQTGSRLSRSLAKRKAIAQAVAISYRQGKPGKFDR